MNIGEFKNVNGQLLGTIATAAMNLSRLGLRPVQSDHARAPKYEVVTLNGRVWVQIGAVWEAKSNSSGEVFLQGSIDDPSFPSSLPIACFGNPQDGYRVAWTRNRRRADSLGQSDSQMDTMGGTDEGARGDGFEGNASADGTLIPGAEGEGSEQGSEPQTGRKGRRASERAQESEVPAFA